MRGLLVRVIEYTHDDPNRPGAGERHRLITDLTNPEDLPAHEAPLVYHERWEEELAFDEIKTHLSGRAVPIRSKTPAGVVQEIYGLMLAHYVVRRVMHDAAVVARQDPDRLSFIDSLRVLQCQLPESPGWGPRRGTAAPAGGAASGAPAAAGPLVCSGHQAKDVELEEEAARAPAPATADQTLS